jgi:chromosome segregation ATPase
MSTSESQPTDTQPANETFVSPIEREIEKRDQEIAKRDQVIEQLRTTTERYFKNINDNDKEIIELNKELAKKDQVIEQLMTLQKDIFKNIDDNYKEIRKLNKENDKLKIQRTENILMYSNMLGNLEKDVEKKDTEIKVLKEILEKYGLNTDVIQNEIQDKIKEYECEILGEKLRQKYSDEGY